MSNQRVSLSIGATLSNFGLPLLNRLLPELCFLCERPGHYICGACLASLPRPSAASCPGCALPSPDALICGQCLKNPPAFDSCHAAFLFTWPLDSVIHAFKYRNGLDLARPMARLMRGELPRQTEVDALIAMPLSPARLRERGYNQAHELARHLAKDYHLPLLTRQMRRKEREHHQAELPLEQRARNVKNVFTVMGKLPPRIAIIDDVMTSGSSMHELALTLKLAGARHVDAWIFSRTYSFSDR